MSDDRKVTEQAQSTSEVPAIDGAIPCVYAKYCIYKNLLK